MDGGATGPGGVALFVVRLSSVTGCALRGGAARLLRRGVVFDVAGFAALSTTRLAALFAVGVVCFVERLAAAERVVFLAARCVVFFGVPRVAFAVFFAARFFATRLVVFFATRLVVFFATRLVVFFAARLVVFFAARLVVFFAARLAVFFAARLAVFFAARLVVFFAVLRVVLAARFGDLLVTFFAARFFAARLAVFFTVRRVVVLARRGVFFAERFAVVFRLLEALALLRAFRPEVLVPPVRRDEVFFMAASRGKSAKGRSTQRRRREQKNSGQLYPV